MRKEQGTMPKLVNSNIENAKGVPFREISIGQKFYTFVNDGIVEWIKIPERIVPDNQIAAPPPNPPLTTNAVTTSDGFDVHFHNYDLVFPPENK